MPFPLQLSAGSYKQTNQCTSYLPRSESVSLQQKQQHFLQPYRHQCNPETPAAYAPECFRFRLRKQLNLMHNTESPQQGFIQLVFPVGRSDENHIIGKSIQFLHQRNDDSILFACCCALRMSPLTTKSMRTLSLSFILISPFSRVPFCLRCPIKLPRFP